MKIALIGDVHANLPALEAVLLHARQKNVDTIWNVGDTVGYGPFPNQVVETLREEQTLSIAGNYDLKVLKYKKKKEKWQTTKHPKKLEAFRWAYEALTKKNRKYLRALPQEVVLRYTSRSILLTHASPASNEDALYPDTPDGHLRKLARMAGVHVIICGHSHQAFARQVDKVWFINTGSVGRPDDGDPRTSYAILMLTAKKLSVEHFRLTYDIEQTISAIRKNNLPEEFAQMLLQGVSLDRVVMP